MKQKKTNAQSAKAPLPAVPLENTTPKLQPVVFALFAVFLGVLAVSALITTADIRGKGANIKWLKDIVFLVDNIPLNLAALVGFAAAFYGLHRLFKTEKFRALPVCFSQVTVAGVIGVVGVLWLASGGFNPWGDPRTVSSCAEAFSRGDYTALQTNADGSFNYLQYYPYQLGYVLYAEVVIRLFGLEGGPFLLFEYLNVFWLMIAASALLGIFPRAKRPMIGVLLVLFLPPIFFTFSTYGNTISFMFAVLALRNLLAFADRGSLRHGVLAAICVALAVCLKLNASIYLIAMVIFLVARFPWKTLKKTKKDEKDEKGEKGEKSEKGEKGGKILICLAATLILGMFLPKVPVLHYESRADVKMPSGVPQICWISMGLHENGFYPPGWIYTLDFTTALYDKNDHDAAATARAARADVRACADYFLADPVDAVRFFWQKTMSEWNEPTFESINDVREFYYNPSNIVKRMMADDMPGWIRWMDFVLQAVFVFGLWGVIALLRRRKFAPVYLLFALVILGGFGYHLLAEAKSRYVLHYTILLLPFAAEGIRAFCDIVDKRVMKR